MIYLISYDKNYIHQILTKQKKCFGRRFSFRKLQGADFLPLLYDEFKADTKDPKTTPFNIFISHVLFIPHSSFFIPHSTLSSSSSTQPCELYYIQNSLPVDAGGDISSLFWLQYANFGHNECHKIKHRFYKSHVTFFLQCKNIKSSSHPKTD